MDVRLLYSALLLAVLCTISTYADQEPDLDGPELLVFTVATNPTDGYQRFMRSAQKYGLSVQVLGMGKKWQGGSMLMTGGGQKILLLRDAMKQYKDMPNKLVMFVDSYDLVFTAGEEEIRKMFDKFNAHVVFSAEDFCWPDQDLTNQYPLVKINEKRYLNSGGFIGYASEIYSILTLSAVQNSDDDQRYYTKIFLDEALREKYSMKLDTKNEIFQNLHGALEEVKVKFKGSNSYLYNARTGNIPLVVHGNGPITTQFNGLTNYLADQWTPMSGCLVCQEGTISLTDVKLEDYPRVLMALFIEKPTPFVDMFLDNIAKLAYPKAKIDLFIHNTQNIHTPEVKAFLASDNATYHSVKVIKPDQQVQEDAARNTALEECIKSDCQYFFSVDSEVQLENRDTLVHLIETNRSIISPVMTRPNKMWSTFWGALTKDGFYKRSDDYVQIVQNERRGLWNVPYISSIYLIHGGRVPAMKGFYTSVNSLDPDMAFCKSVRRKSIFMYADNLAYYGLLTNPDNYPKHHLHNDLWALFDNKQMWEKKYVDPDYWAELSTEVENLQPCPDVYWFPAFTHKWADDLVEEAENFGKWSGGGHEGKIDKRVGQYEAVPTVDVHLSQFDLKKIWLFILDEYIRALAEKVYRGYKSKDERLAGGYENVPTVDIHMNQLELEQAWLRILRDYISPLANKIYQGYYSEARATMNFIVRYRPGEQNYLRPHHDTSTYSLNIALNHPSIDFKGGGTRFLRYNCEAHSKKGWMVMHPGRLTHWHEGLPTTNGTRYIMVCFVDP